MIHVLLRQIFSDTFDWHVKVVLSFKSGSVTKKYDIGEFRGWPFEEPGEGSRVNFKEIKSVILSQNEIKIIGKSSVVDLEDDSEDIVSQDTTIVKF